jgi:Arc/MetJ-type ribon-helix-helix transcriptional regulator
VADHIVSVRMPESLVEELRTLSEKNHYLDVSELIRSLLREKWLEHSDPYSVQLLAIRENLSKTQVPERIRTLKEDLRKLLEEIDGLSKYDN